MTNATFHERFSYAQLAIDDKTQDPNGRVFISGAGFFDLGNVKLLASTVDTVRQLYSGMINSSGLYSQVKIAVEQEIFQLDGVLGGLSWHVGRLSKTSGYRYKLQNNEEGIIILVGSFYVKEDISGSHLKIELSPSFVSQRGYQDVQNRLDAISRAFLLDSIPSGVSVHLALDVQGWNLPKNFEEKFVTYSRAKRSFDGISSFDFTDLSTCSTRYGKIDIETVTYGKPNGLQTCIYRKDIEIVHSDKVDYFHNLWNKGGEFIPDEPVWRVEMRFHHSVIREIGLGLEIKFDTYAEVVEHLTDIWRYALLRNRLDHNSRFISPIWQLFIEDAIFLYPANGLYIKRRKKKDVAAISKNLGLIIGNLVSIGARQQFTPKDMIYQLKKLFIWPLILQNCKIRGQTEFDFLEAIEKSLMNRRLLGKQAA